MDITKLGKSHRLKSSAFFAESRAGGNTGRAAKGGTHSSRVGFANRLLEKFIELEINRSGFPSKDHVGTKAEMETTVLSHPRTCNWSTLFDHEWLNSPQRHSENVEMIRFTLRCLEDIQDSHEICGFGYSWFFFFLFFQFKIIMTSWPHVCMIKNISNPDARNSQTV